MAEFFNGRHYFIERIFDLIKDCPEKRRRRFFPEVGLRSDILYIIKVN